MDDEVKLAIIGLVYNQAIVNTYGLVLEEENGTRRFSIMIGEPEAQSIALKINKKVLARPLTHDLINNILTAFGARLKKVLIYDLINEIFYSELHVENKEGEIMIIDARTSDAVALAVRAESPIYIKKEILDIVGTETEPNLVPENTYENLDSYAVEEMTIFPKEDLEEFLEKAVKDEKYELAVKIRNAIDYKEKNNL